MITVIKEGKTPIYQVECYECKSILRYTRADVSLMHITCPICKCSVGVYYHPADEVETNT